MVGFLVKHWRVSTIILLVLAMLVLIQRHRRADAELRARAANAALRSDSLQAIADSTRMVSAAAAGILGDSLQGVERRVVQEAQRADALDRALRRERIATYTLGVRVDSLQTVIAGLPTREVEGVRVGEFAQDVKDSTGTTWASVRAKAELPPPPTAGRLTLAVALQPITLELRPGCGPANELGIRPATVAVIGPTWAKLQIGQVSQSMELCQSPALAPKGPSRTTWFLAGSGVALLLTALAVWVL